ncbi:uncharacterized protein TNCV_3079581 [Trichonephila clavipes]|nr:uncharacterized protein TNCV_3079581 [Trichonephila clavipes]
MLRRSSFASTLRQISWCFYQAIGSIQVVSVKVSTHQHLDDGMTWRILGRPEADQYHVQVCREFSLTPSVVCNLWKQFLDYWIHREKAWAGSSESHDGQGRSPFFDYSDAENQEHASLEGPFRPSGDCRKSPGGALDFDENRNDQTALSRLLTGHLKGMTFESGRKVFQAFSKCHLLPASTEYSLDCLGLALEDVYASPLLVLDLARVNGLMDPI